MVLPIALALVSGGLSLAGSLEANKNARRQYKFQRRLQKINAQIANEQANRSINQIRTRQVQERAALAQQSLEITDRAREALGVSVTQAAETGTAGASLAALQDDFIRQELNAQQAIQRSQGFRDQQADVSAAQVRTSQRVSSLNSLPDPLQRQGILEILGGAASAAFQSYVSAGGKFPEPTAATASARVPQIPLTQFATNISQPNFYLPSRYTIQPTPDLLP